MTMDTNRPVVAVDVGAGLGETVLHFLARVKRD